MPPIDSVEEDEARASSLVCRENAKLRKRNAELEAMQSEALSELRQELLGRPTKHQLEEANKAAESAVVALEEATTRAIAAEEVSQRLKAEVLEAKQAEQAAVDEAKAEAQEAAARERGLEREIDVLRKRAEAAESDVKGAATQAAQLERLEQQLMDARRDCEKWKAEVQDLERAYKAAELEVLRLRDSAAAQTADQDVGALRAALAGLKKQASDLTVKVRKAEESEQAAARRATAAVPETAETKRAVETIEAQRRADRKKHKQEVEAVQKDLRDALAEDAAFRESIGAQISELTDRLALYEGGDSQMAKDLKRMRQEAAEQRTRADGAQRDLTGEREASAELRLRVEELELELSRLRAELDSLLHCRAQPVQTHPFGEYVHLKREIAGLKVQLESSGRGHPQPNSARMASERTGQRAGLGGGHYSTLSHGGTGMDPATSKKLDAALSMGHGSGLSLRSVQAVAASRMATSTYSTSGSQTARPVVLRTSLQGGGMLAIGNDRTVLR